MWIYKCTTFYLRYLSCMSIESHWAFPCSSHDYMCTCCTGTVVVVILIVLLWIYSMYRMWIVWAYTLNFDQVPSTIIHYSGMCCRFRKRGILFVLPLNFPSLRSGRFRGKKDSPTSKSPSKKARPRRYLPRKRLAHVDISLEKEPLDTFHAKNQIS